MNLKPSVFTKINESFTCLNCGFLVPRAQQTCRDHCPKCLHSLHVDINPGDRAAECGGVLKPIGWSQNKKKGYIIHYVCQTCSAKKVNKFIEHDIFLSDSIEALINLSNVTLC